MPPAGGIHRAQPSGGASRRADGSAGALQAPALGRVELGSRRVQHQPFAPELFWAPFKFGLDRAPPVIGRHEPQHRPPFGNDDIVFARRLRIDRPLDVVALQRELSRPVMLNPRLPSRQHLQRGS